jgi:hypothetical protein
MSLLSPANAVVIYRGTSKTLELTVTDASGNPVDLTGSTIYFTVKKCIEEQEVLFQKRSTDPLQIEITQPKAGKAKIYIQPIDTSSLEIRSYKFDVLVVLSSGKRYIVVPPTDLTVQLAVTVLA